VAGNSLITSHGVCSMQKRGSGGLDSRTNTLSADTGPELAA